jgi:hypothetical protein
MTGSRLIDSLDRAVGVEGLAAESAPGTEVRDDERAAR